MKKIIVVLLLMPTICFAAETEFFRDANFYCFCIASKPDDITYTEPADWTFVDFFTDTGTITLEAEHYGFQSSVQYSKFGPWIRFSGDCDTRGRGFALAGLISFKYLDDCQGLAFNCKGFRYWKRPTVR